MEKNTITQKVYYIFKSYNNLISLMLKIIFIDFFFLGVEEVQFSIKKDKIQKMS